MKKQIKNMFLSIALLSSLPIATLFCGAQPQIRQAGPGMQVPAGMPSVADVFGGMSEDEIIKQVQEAQKFFESLSPEEMAELEKMVAQTLDTMSPQDLEDIQGIAKMVEPHIEVPKEKDLKDKKVEEVKKESSVKKDKADEIDTDDIKKMITSINSQIEEVFQKAESSKDAIEEIKNKWSSKATFDNMKRQVSALKEDRLLKKLSKAEHKEDKDLVDKLKNFHKDLTKHNDNYKIEDTFGVPTSRTIEAKNLKKTQDILSMFENHIDEVMPPMEKFLRKYDPEALEMAKEAEDRAKKSTMHEKDAELRRASLPSTPPLPSHTGRSGGGSLSQGSGGMGYDPYGYPGNYGSYSDAGYRDYPGSKKSSNTPSASSGGSGQSSQDKKDDTKQQKKEDKKAFEDLVDLFKEYKEMYGDKHVDIFKNFISKDIAAYPDATKPIAPAATPITPSEQKDWVESKGAYMNQGFEAYQNKILQGLKPYETELNDMHDMLDTVATKIAEITPEQADKLVSHSDLNYIRNRIEKYKDTYEKALKDIDTMFISNTVSVPAKGGAPAVVAPITDPVQLNNYQSLHTAFINKLNQKFAEQLTSLELKLDKIKRKAKAHHRKSKAGKNAQAALHI